MPSRESKEKYFEKLTTLLDEYNKILFFGADHVGSYQFQQIRIALRGKAIVLMGKNTLIRKVVFDYCKGDKTNPLMNILPQIKGNVCLIFTDVDIGEIRDVVEENRVPAMAKAGVIAECDVIVPAGPTGCDPGQTAWFQALNVPTKISRGQIEIISELKLVSVGQKVGGSEAALLQKLEIRPFTYGLALQCVYDNGSIFSAAVLGISDDDLKQKFITGCRRIAALGLACGYPTLASLPHSVGNAIRRMIALAGVTDIDFAQCAEWNPLFGKGAEAPAAAE